MPLFRSGPDSPPPLCPFAVNNQTQSEPVDNNLRELATVRKWSLANQLKLTLPSPPDGKLLLVYFPPLNRGLES